MDVGYAEGDTVTPFYDPMLALVIAHGRDRNSAIARLDGALADFAVEGVKTNIPFLRSMLASDAFERCEHHTTFAEGFASRPEHERCRIRGDVMRPSGIRKDWGKSNGLR